MDLQRINDKYIGIRSDIKPKERTVYLESKVMQMYRSAIVNELGHVMFWCDELQGNEQIECILSGHPEWSIKCVEI